MHGTRNAVKVQGQEVKGQGHGVTICAKIPTIGGQASGQAQVEFFWATWQ